jgi:hypothetical protein
MHHIWPQTHVLVRFVMFICYMNFGAKQAELMQLMHKFMPQSRVGIFCNKRTRSTPLDPLWFWGIWDCFVAAWTLVQNGRRNFSQQTHRIHPFGPQTHVLVHLGPFRYCTNFSANAPDPPYGTLKLCLVLFGPFHYYTSRAKLVSLVHKFVQQSHDGIFHNERRRSTPLDPKLKFGVFQTVSLLHELSGKTGRTSAVNAQVHAMMLLKNFFATNASKPPHWTPNSCFGASQTVTLLHELQCKTGWTCAINPQVWAMKLSRNLSQNAPDPPHLTSNSCFGAFRNIPLLHELWCETGRTNAIKVQIRATKSCHNFSQ